MHFTSTVCECVRVSVEQATQHTRQAVFVTYALFCMANEIRNITLVPRSHSLVFGVRVELASYFISYAKQTVSHKTACFVFM